MPDEIEVLRHFRDETPEPSTDAWARARAAIAAAQAEETPNVPQHRRAPGHRRRWLTPGVVLTGVAAAVTALLAVLLPGSPVGVTGGHISTDAYVTRVEHALSQAGQANLITYARSQYPDGISMTPAPSQIRAGSAGGQRVSSMVRWTYQDSTKLASYDAAGHPVFAMQLRRGTPGTVVTTAVFYREATWWRASVSGLGHLGQGRIACGPGIQLGAGGWPATIRAELTCGRFTLDGRQQVDGVNALRITGTSPALTLWVDPASYLPVRITMNGPAPSQTDFRWLSPTSARLAQLGLQIPAHFRQVAPPS